jgi:DNA-binding HxlR family transcriptional regulator
VPCLPNAPKIPSHVCISKGLLNSVMSNHADVKALAALYCLKGSLTCGRIKRYYALRATLAANFGISARTLDKYVARLEAMGYVRKHYRYADAPTSYDLVLCSSKRLGSEHGTSTAKYHKIQFTTLRELVITLDAVGAREKKNQNTYAITQKRQNAYLKSNRTAYPATLQPAARKRALRGYDDEAQAAKDTTHFAHQVATADYTTTPARIASPHADMSLNGLRKVFGCKSKTTCARRLKAMQEAGLIEVKKHRIATNFPATLKEYAILRETTLKGDYSYQWEKGTIYKVMPNVVTFLPSITL